MPFLLGKNSFHKGFLYKIEEGDNFIVPNQYKYTLTKEASSEAIFSINFNSSPFSLSLQVLVPSFDVHVNGAKTLKTSLQEKDEILVEENVFQIIFNENDFMELDEKKILLCEADRFIVLEKDMATSDNFLSTGEYPELYEIGYCLNTAKTKEELISRIYQIIYKKYSQSRFLLFLWKEKSGYFEKQEPLQYSASIQMSRTLVSLVLSDRKAVLSQDILQDARFKGSESLHGQSIHSIMCAPLIWLNQVFGFLYIDSTPKYEFSKDDFHYFLNITNQTALALLNLEMFDRLSKENQQLKALVKKPVFIGNSPNIQNVLNLIKKVAPTDLTVLIRGETGTGKELVAKLIHETSTRRSDPFVCVNCAALNESLLESELFGHEKGAFTHAVETKKGKLELENGTIFLDEIGEIPVSLQVKLLRFLQEKELERVGGIRKIKVNARIIAATNRDLEAAIESGEFRRDLYYRLKAFEIYLPPLRERKGDLEPLFHYFMMDFCQKLKRPPYHLPEEVMEFLKTYSWPGNIREYKNVIEQAIILCPDYILRKEHFASFKEHTNLQTPSSQIPHQYKAAEEEFVKQYFHHLLSYTHGNITQSSVISGLNRSYIHEVLKKFSIEAKNYRS